MSLLISSAREKSGVSRWKQAQSSLSKAENRGGKTGGRKRLNSHFHDDRRTQTATRLLLHVKQQTGVYDAVSSQQLAAHRLQLLELLLLVLDGLQARQQGGVIAAFQRLVSGLELVPAGLEALHVRHVGADVAGGVAPHQLHLGRKHSQSLSRKLSS